MPCLRVVAVKSGGRIGGTQFAARKTQSHDAAYLSPTQPSKTHTAHVASPTVYVAVPTTPPVILAPANPYPTLYPTTPLPLILAVTILACAFVRQSALVLIVFFNIAVILLLR